MRTFKIVVMQKDYQIQTFRWQEENESRQEPEQALCSFLVNKYFKYKSYTYYREHTMAIEPAEAPFYLGIRQIWYVTNLENGREYVYVTTLV